MSTRNYGLLKVKYIAEDVNQYDIPAKGQKSEDLKRLKKDLGIKKERIKELESQKAALAEKGRTLDSDDEALLKRLYIKVAGMEETIARIEESLKTLSRTSRTARQY